MRISDWSSDVCSSDLADIGLRPLDRRRDDMVAGLERQAVADQAGRHGRPGVDDDVPEPVALARREREDGLKPPVARLIQRGARGREVGWAVCKERGWQEA